MDDILSPVERHTERYTLRPFRRRDVEPLYDAVVESFPELHQWLPWAHKRYSRFDASNFVKDSARAWREGRAYDFAVRSHAYPEDHVGNMSIWFTSRAFRVGEVGYWINSGLTEDGVATECARRIIEVGFEELKMHRIILRIAVGNRASERVAEKLGFVREGVLREELKVRGQWLDHSIWGLLDHEYQGLAQGLGAVQPDPSAETI
jgi:ribosomal-protein-serine acetyltransferase